MNRPRLLLLDEPTEGIAPVLVQAFGHQPVVIASRLPKDADARDAPHQHDISLFDGVLPMLSSLKTRHHWLAVANEGSKTSTLYQLDVQPVPEPASIALFSCGLLGLALAGRCDASRRPSPVAAVVEMAGIGHIECAT